MSAEAMPKLAHWEVTRVTEEISRQSIVDTETGETLWSSEFLWDDLASLAEADERAEDATAQIVAKGWVIPNERYIH